MDKQIKLGYQTAKKERISYCLFFLGQNILWGYAGYVETFLTDIVIAAAAAAVTAAAETADGGGESFSALFCILFVQKEQLRLLERRHQ